MHLVLWEKRKRAVNLFPRTTTLKSGKRDRRFCSKREAFMEVKAPLSLWTSSPQALSEWVQSHHKATLLNQCSPSSITQTTGRGNSMLLKTTLSTRRTVFCNSKALKTRTEILPSWLGLKPREIKMELFSLSNKTGATSRSPPIPSNLTCTCISKEKGLPGSKLTLKTSFREWVLIFSSTMEGCPQSVEGADSFLKTLLRKTQIIW